MIFFPVLVSTIGVGFTFKILLDPFHGLVNRRWRVFGITGPGWLTEPRSRAVLSVAGIDIWKGVGIATLIFIAGIVAIPQEYYEAAEGRRRQRLADLPQASPSRCSGRPRRR